MYKICFYSIEDNEYIWFQYRILHRILGVCDLLSEMKNIRYRQLQTVW